MTECQEKQNNQTVSTSPTNECVELENHSDSILALDEAGPSGPGGKGIWGAVTDAKRIYINIANFEEKNFVLNQSKKNTSRTFTAYGPVGVANDVVFAGSTHPEGPIYAMDAKTGKNLWLYETRAAVYGGMSVSGGCIYLSNGYTVSL
ncbi:hypothetical protein CICLE_v10013770mg [Citrus x clementina]|uniref:Uncharacterized protein n=1 Tax=Citrus clementina TaxID=85681 RepID=V4SUC2_CITCL|nr:hypothetical protein CICLE_v10013770mg [Citrus x clementina]